MPIKVEPSKNWPGRLDVNFTHRPDANHSVTIALTEEDADDLAIRIEEWQDYRRRLRQERPPGPPNPPNPPWNKPVA